LNAELDQLVLRAQTRHLRLDRVQSQSARAEPGLDIIETAEKTVNRNRRIVDWRADVAVTKLLAWRSRQVYNHSRAFSRNATNETV